jgi:hypothetical protein
MFNSLKPKEERVKKDSRRVGVKIKYLGERRGALYSYLGRGGGKSILLEGTQELPVFPSDKDGMRVKRRLDSTMKSRGEVRDTLFSEEGEGASFC